MTSGAYIHALLLTPAEGKQRKKHG